MSRSKYRELPYIKRQESCGLEVNDKVIVTRTAEDLEDGWGNGWVPSMTDAYNSKRILTVLEFQEESGVLLSDEFFYPYFVLEKVEVSIYNY